jgi:hypothetical protein
MITIVLTGLNKHMYTETSTHKHVFRESSEISFYGVRHKSVNTPLSHERLVVRTWLAVYSGWG